MNTLVNTARVLAKAKLAEPLPRRWSHVQAVGRKADTVAPRLLEQGDATTVQAAAWLHDIGYAPDLAITGFHPLDGARWLRTQGIADQVVCLVAHHSCATLEAEERGLLDELESEFFDESSQLTNLLIYVDMTTGPDGQHLDVEDRLTEIGNRYGPGDLITRFIGRAHDRIIAAVRAIESELGNQPR